MHACTHVQPRVCCLCVLSIKGTPEQKAALSTVMKQHADQVSSLRAQKRELDETIARQAELISATLQVMAWGRLKWCRWYLVPSFTSHIPAAFRRKLRRSIMSMLPL